MAKAWLIQRLNINWDEFYFLNHVHEMRRGGFALLFQGAYVHVFGWLTSVGPDEIAQIRAARYAALALLSLTALFIWILARRWVKPSLATLAPLAYLSMSPVLVHGASFRADAMLAPLSVLVIILLTRPVARPRDVWLAGVIMGVALAMTVKAALLLPVIALVVLFQPNTARVGAAARFRTILGHGLSFSIAALVAFALIIGWHYSTLQQPPVQTPMAFAEASASKTLLSPQADIRYRYFFETLDEDRFAWLLMVAGLAVSLWTRRWHAAAVALSVAPVLFYRNAFPYYYVVMLAPASVLVPIGIEKALDEISPRYAHARRWIPSAVMALLALGALDKVRGIRWDLQAGQASIVSAVHHIFPQSLTYVDHCGMISTFSKTGPFLSTWGIDAYRQRGVPFMPEALRRRAAFVLSNSPLLIPGGLRAKTLLLPEDRRILESMYVPYWGPIHVAGADVTLQPNEIRDVPLPFPGSYRLEGQYAVLVDGRSVEPGESFGVGSNSTAQIAQVKVGPSPIELKLIWAEAYPPPPRVPPKGIFNAL